MTPRSFAGAARSRGRWRLWASSLLAGWLLALLGVYAVAQIGHTTWLRGSTYAVEQDLLGAVWPLAQSFDSVQGYGYTGDNPFPHLIQGEYGGTAFYPPGYPLLLWVTDRVIGDPVRASQILNGLASVLFVLSVYWVGLGWTGKRGLALLAAAIATSASVFMTLAYAASTDLLALSLAMSGFACALWSLRSHAARSWLIWAAILLALAFLVRRQAAVMLPPLLMVAILSTSAPRERAIRAATMLLAFCAVAMPDWVIQYQLHGNPFYSAHGKNIWNATVNDFDWPAYHSVPNTISPFAVVLEDVRAFIGNWLRNIVYYAQLPWIGVATLLVVPGAYFAWRRKLYAPTLWSVLTAVFVVIVVSVSERGDRHALIVVPVLAVLAAAAIWYGTPRRWRLMASAAVILVTAPVSVGQTALIIGSELQVPHLEAVTEALREDGANRGDVLTSFGSAHYAFYANTSFEPLPGDVRTWSDLESFMESNGIDYYVARGIGLHAERLTESLEPATAPASMTALYISPADRHSGRIILYRYTGR